MNKPKIKQNNFLKTVKRLVGQGQRPCRSPQRAKHLWAKPNISFFLNRRILSADKFLLPATLVSKGGQSPPFKGKRC